MCRLLAWAAPAPRPPAELLAPEELARLEALGRFHADGWGLAALLPEGRDPSGAGDPSGVGGRLSVHRSVEPAGSDPGFAGLLGSVAARAGIVHLRRATPGITVSVENTHPFACGGWAFAHNGSIAPLSALDSLLTPASRARRRGGTDSECYFLALLERLESSDSPLEAVRQVVAEVRAACGPHGMNACAVSSTTLLVVQAAAGAAPSRAALVEQMGAGVEDPGAGIEPEHLEDYFGLRYRIAAGSLLVSSTGAPGPAWSRLPPESVLSCDLGSGRVVISPLAPGPPLAGFELAGFAARDLPVVP